MEALRVNKFGRTYRTGTQPAQAIAVELLFNLYVNVQLVKRDIVTAVIFCYITTEFHYANRDSRLSAYGGVMLQRICIEKKVNRHFAVRDHFRRCTGLSSLLLLFFVKINCK